MISMSHLYRFSIGYNDSYAFRDYPSLTDSQRGRQEFVPDMSGRSESCIRRCDICGEMLRKWEEPLSNLSITRKRLDIGSTYDGITIVTARFRDACHRGGLSGIEYRPLPNEPGLFAIRPVRSVEYDPAKRGTRFINYCSACGSYESVVGATPVYLKDGFSVAPQELVRTDIEFGSNDNKSPLVLCGTAAAEVLRAEHLNGLELEEVANC